jgi:type I restriction enzyme, S subunit
MTRPTAKPSDAAPAFTPKLRFPEFRNAPAWESKELHTIAEPVSERADNEDENNILTLSGEHGLVLQSEYFGKQIAGTNSERYLKIERDDFVYNDRTTKASEYGTIKRLTKHPHGIVSPIYKCFRFHAGELPVFWEWYFESGAHEAQLRSLANEGARAGRFNVSIDRFLSTSVCTPQRGSAEQQKIAECLSTLDELIGAESQKLDALKAHKKGLMQQLFPREGETLPRLRFPEFHSAPEWEEGSLTELFDFRDGFTFKSTDFTSELGDTTQVIRITDINNQNKNEDKVYVSNAFLEKIDLRKYYAEKGELLLSLTGAAGFNFFVWDGDPALLNQRTTKITPKDPNNGALIHLLEPLVHEKINARGEGQNNNLNREFLSTVILRLPKPAEQHRIATCLSSLDDLIAAQSARLAALQTHKQGLLQQLFPSPAAADA